MYDLLIKPILKGLAWIVGISALFACVIGLWLAITYVGFHFPKITGSIIVLALCWVIGTDKLK